MIAPQHFTGAQLFWIVVDPEHFGRAAVEPVYGLRLITCSRCGRAVVRRWHPIDRAWRRFLRLKTTILSLLLRGLLPPRSGGHGRRG